MIQTLFGSLEEEQKPSFLERMKEAVTRTRESLAERIEEAVAFSKEIDRNTLDELEATLIAADLGTTTTHEVLAKLREKADRKQIKNVDELKRFWRHEVLTLAKVRKATGYTDWPVPQYQRDLVFLSYKAAEINSGTDV